MYRHFNTVPVEHYDHRPAKEFLENYTYTRIGKKMVSNVLAITGPAIDRHITNASKIANRSKCKMYFIEIEPRIYKIMCRRKENSELNTKKVNIGLGNFVDYNRIFGLQYPCRFIDLDLCQTLEKTMFLIYHSLRHQSMHINNKYNNGYKCLMITASLRGDSRKNNKGNNTAKTLLDLNILLNVIDARIDIKNTIQNKTRSIFKGVNKLSPVIINQGRLKTLDIFSYKDGAPMMSFVILYK